jgi:hypothetical protein
MQDKHRVVVQSKWRLVLAASLCLASFGEKGEGATFQATFARFHLATRDIHLDSTKEW